MKRVEAATVHTTKCMQQGPRMLRTVGLAPVCEIDDVFMDASYSYIKRRERNQLHFRIQHHRSSPCRGSDSMI